MRRGVQKAASEPERRRQPDTWPGAVEAGGAPTRAHAVSSDDQADNEATAAARVRADEIIETARRQSADLVEVAEADAEQLRAQARRLLVAAQTEALSLVAETQARIDQRLTRDDVDHSVTNVESLTSEIRALIDARDRAMEGLQALRQDLESLVSSNNAT